MANHSNNLEKCKENIGYILQNLGGKRENIAFRVYEEIVSTPGHEAQALKFFCEYPFMAVNPGKKEVEEIFEPGDKSYYIYAYGKLIDGALEALLQKNMNCEKFYAELWDFIENSPILTEKKQKAFALYFIWIDARIPYYELEPGIKMENDKFKSMTDKLQEILVKARFILFTPTEQRTERASRLLKLLEETDRDEEKAVVLAHIMGILEIRNHNAAVRRGKKK